MFLFKVKLTSYLGTEYNYLVVARDALGAHARAMVSRRNDGLRSSVSIVSIERISDVDEIAPDVLAALRAKPSKRARKGAGGAK